VETGKRVDRDGTWARRQRKFLAEEQSADELSCKPSNRDRGRGCMVFLFLRFDTTFAVLPRHTHNNDLKINKKRVSF
jgi:hypothetical protein